MVTIMSKREAAVVAKKKRTTDERALLTDVDGLVAMTNSCRDMAYKLIREREVESFLQGRSRRITIASIKGYIERKLASASTFERARYPAREGGPPDT
jgi:hypothetical protein